MPGPSKADQLRQLREMQRGGVRPEPKLAALRKKVAAIKPKRRKKRK